MARPELWQAPPRGGRLVPTLALLFVLAILVARLALAGHAALVVLAVPVLWLALALTVGVLPALILVALWLGAVAGLWAYFRYVNLGWPVLLVLPAAALAAAIAVRVVRQMRPRLPPEGGGDQG